MYICIVPFKVLYICIPPYCSKGGSSMYVRIILYIIKSIILFINNTYPPILSRGVRNIVVP